MYFDVLMFKKLNNEVRTLNLPFPVHGKGVGDRSRFAEAKLLGYRRNLCSCAGFEHSRDIGFADEISRRLENALPLAGGVGGESAARGIILSKE